MGSVSAKQCEFSWVRLSWAEQVSWPHYCASAPSVSCSCFGPRDLPRPVLLMQPYFATLQCARCHMNPGQPKLQCIPRQVLWQKLPPHVTGPTRCPWPSTPITEIWKSSSLQANVFFDDRLTTTPLYPPNMEQLTLKLQACSSLQK